MSDEQYLIKELEEHHIQHAVSMAEDAGMQPNAFEELDFFRTDGTSEFVGLFSASNEDKQNEVPLGVGGLLHDEERDYLVLLIVDKEHRRKGIGQKLVKWAIDRGKKEKSTKVLQLVASKMGSPLYKSLGFVDVGYTNLYRLKIGGSNKVVVPETSKRKVLSFRLTEMTSISNGEILWQQAQEMLLEATCSNVRTTRTCSLLQNSTIYLAYDEEESSKPKLKAWTAMRHFSQKGHVLGPLLGCSVEDAIELVLDITRQASTLRPEIESLVIHTDGQSGQEPQLAKALEEAEWEKVITLERLDLALKGQQLHDTKQAEKASGSKQFALTDFSHQ